jgi:hypothetical protein
MRVGNFWSAAGFAVKQRLIQFVVVGMGFVEVFAPERKQPKGFLARQRVRQAAWVRPWRSERDEFQTVRE